MSFQDVGKPGGPRRSPNSSPMRPNIHSSYDASRFGNPQSNNSSNVGNNGQLGPDDHPGYAQISDGILQYQRNAGILGKITRQIGTKTDGPVVQTQYKVQVDVIRQLGSKLEKQIQDQEANMQSMSRTDAARSRATHVKLVRDYRRVEAQFKNLQLETRRKKEMVEVRRRDDRERKKLEEENLGAEHGLNLHRKLEDDRINEEIMREREQEIMSINHGMQTVNQIYKDLAGIVGNQQNDIDQIETQMDESNNLAQAGLKHVEKANESKQQCIIS